MMGGNLAITVREPDGKEHRMDRWTNSMPAFVQNIDLIEKNPEHIKSYLQTWYDFRQDWEENKDKYFAAKILAETKVEEKGGNFWDYMPKMDFFKYNMTSVYADHPFLAPSEYGQVVVDMVNNKILHAQGYSDFASIYGTSAKVMLYQEGEHEFWNRLPKYPYSPSTHCRLREFFEAGRITEIFVHSSLDTSNLKKIEDIKDSNELLAYLKQENPYEERRHQWYEICETEGVDYDADDPRKPPIWPDEYANFRLDFSPFEVIRFSESAQGFRDMKEAVLELGFTLSDEEDKMWDDWISDRFEYDSDESE